MKKLLSENNKGITLIALVITIIVLLILAGITIAMITGQDSAPEKAAEAKIENDRGAAKDAAALLVTGKIQDYYDGKYVNKTVTDGTILAYLERELSSSKAVTTGEYKVVVADGKITVTKGTETMATGTVSNEGVITWDGTSSGGTTPQTPTEPLEIGDMVNYSTSLNGVTLDNWKVFYKENKSGTEYTYLILDGYLPNSAISTTMKSTYNLTTGGTNPFTKEEDLYNVYAQNNRADLINALSTKSNWNNLLQGTINGHAVNETANANAWAMGSPTLDLWVNSWNAKYPSDTLYTATSSAMSDGLNGYYIGESSSPNDTYLNLSSKAGYDNILYWISKTNDSYGYADDLGMYGYWLASCSAYHANFAIGVSYGGDVGYCGYGSNNVACRPVVCLPSSVVNQ